MVFESRKFKLRFWGMRIPFTIGAGAQMRLADKLVVLGVPEGIIAVVINAILDWFDQVL